MDNNINNQSDVKDSLKNDFVASDSNKKITSTNPYGAGRPALTDKLDQDFLDRLTAYASQSITNQEIAVALDISFTSFYKLMRISPEFKAAYEQGIDNRKYALEKALLKRAEGFTVEEKQTVVTKDPEKGTIVKNTVTQKNYVPDTTALIFSLSNIYSDKYKQRVESVNTVNINVSQIQNLPDEELLKYVNVDLLNSADYKIE